MKPIHSCWVICMLFTFQTYGQFQPVSNLNYYNITAYYDTYYDSLFQSRGYDSLEGTGYKDYMRWKHFYHSRNGIKGDLEGYWNGVKNFHEANGDSLPSEDLSEWKFAGPFGIPPGPGNSPRKQTGKGMATALWVNPSNKDHILAGGHHGGLWVTNDGGENWFPKHDDDGRIFGINSIAVNPYDHNDIFITCNSSLANVSSYSAGLYKSGNGGETWDKSNTGVIYELNYPAGFWGSTVRKVIYHPTIEDHVYFLSYRNLIKSDDNGESWDTLLHREYFPWGDTVTTNIDYQKGFFDIKIAPWDDSLLYIAGSEVFELRETGSGIDTLNLSDSIFLTGLQPGDSLKFPSYRTEIAMHPDCPGSVWFCSVAEYYRDDTTGFYIRIVKYNPSSHFEVIYDTVQWSGLLATDNKLEFSLSGYDTNSFYLGGINLYKVNTNHIPPKRFLMHDDPWTGDSWVHFDIREMVLFSDNVHDDTIFLANDAGVSWGTTFEQGGNSDTAWHWRNPFETMTNGLEITEFYGIGLSSTDPVWVAGGCQDLSDMLYDGERWWNFGEGDGGEVVFDTENPETFYFYDWQKGTLWRTDDKAETNDWFYAAGASYVMAPMTLDPDDPSILFYGNYELIKFSDVNNFSNNEVEADTLINLNYKITDIEVIRPTTGSKWYYISTEKRIPWDDTITPYTEYDSCIFKTAGGTNWTDISPGLKGCKYGFVSDIEVNPENISQLWVAFANYSAHEQDTAIQNKKVFTSTNGGSSWSDFSQGLEPGLPVQKIIYVPWLQRLFAGTDVGVYYRDLQDTSWSRYSRNLPKKIVTDLEVDEPSGRIYASTYGRGLWVSPVYCHYVDTPLVVNQSVTWSRDTTLDRSVTITSGDTLEIVNCRVNLPTEAKIVVQRGATLILDGAVLSGSCNDLWWGVEVWGDPKANQEASTQGKIILKDEAVIEQARKAIFMGKDIEGGHPDKDYTGGIVDARNAIFRNNRLGIMLWTYSYDNASIIRECQFKNTQFLADGSEPEFFIALLQVRGVEIESCTFECTLPDQVEHKLRGSGIFAVDAGFEIKPHYQEDTAAIFKELNYGIYSAKYFEDLPNKIHDCYFESNLTGVYASGLLTLELYNNDFFINNDSLAEGAHIYGGAYLDNCTGYFVEENEFYSSPFHNYDYPYKNVGITINNSGEADNLLYRNTFKNLYIGSLAQNVNRGEELNVGLKIRCNIYEGNDYDIAVTGSQGCTGCGIAEYQGSSENPASNLFSQKLPLDYNDQVERIYYYHHRLDQSGDTTDSPWIPRYYTDSIILSPTFHQFNYDLYCEPHDTIYYERETLSDIYNTSGLQADSVDNLLGLLVDGGDTQALEMDISFSQPDDAIILRDQLLQDSPYLSDTILIQSAKKEDVLSPVFIKEIMVANPQSAKSGKVVKALEERQDTIPPYMMSEILQGRDSIAHKEILDAELSYWRGNQQWAMNRLNALDRVDSSGVQSDSIIARLENLLSLSNAYSMIETYMSSGDTMQAQNLYDSIPVLFQLNQFQGFNHQQWGLLLNEYYHVFRDTIVLFEIDSSMIETFESLAIYENRPGCLARNILTSLGIEEFGPYYLLPDDQLKNRPAKELTSDGNQKDIQIPDFKIYPNPAGNYLVVEYNLEKYAGNALFEIFSIDGKIQQRVQLLKGSNHKIISTKGFESGVYFYNFTFDYTIQQTGKIVIID